MNLTGPVSKAHRRERMQRRKRQRACANPDSAFPLHRWSLWAPLSARGGGRAVSGSTGGQWAVDWNTGQPPKPHPWGTGGALEEPEGQGGHPVSCQPFFPCFLPLFSTLWGEEHTPLTSSCSGPSISGLTVCPASPWLLRSATLAFCTNTSSCAQPQGLCPAVSFA